MKSAALPLTVCRCASVARCETRSRRWLAIDGERDEADRAHAGERDPPAESRAQREAHDRCQRVAQVAADSVRAVRVAEPSRRDARVEDREIGRVEHSVADSHERHDRKQPADAGDEARDDDAAGRERESGEQHRTRAEPIDGEPRQELRDAARRVVDGDERAEHRVARSELGAQQREERRQRELEKMRHQMREADDADHFGVAAERVGAGEIQGGNAGKPQLYWTRAAPAAARAVRLPSFAATSPSL